MTFMLIGIAGALAAGLAVAMHWKSGRRTPRMALAWGLAGVHALVLVFLWTGMLGR
jgi:hypothetical protein